MLYFNFWGRGKNLKQTRSMQDIDGRAMYKKLFFNVAYQKF